MSTVIYGSGNITLTNNLIQGDFSNAAPASRVMFQTNAANSPTTVAAIPNGTDVTSVFCSFGSSDPTNAPTMNLLGTSTEGSLRASRTGTGSYLPMTFYTGGLERARIGTNGDFSAYNTVYLNGATPGFATQTSGASGHVWQLGFTYWRNTAATSGTYWRAAVDSANAFTLYTNTGAGVYIVNGGTSWAANSDERVKDIIEPITDAANKVSTLRAVIGKYKNDEEGTRRSFLIAQDVQKVLPEAVNVQEDEIGTLGVQYTDLIPLLVAAVKELKTSLDATKAELATLKGAA